MLHVFADVIQRVYASQAKLISIDNAAFKLHYRLTFWMLLGCTFVVCSRQYIGEHIRCVTDKSVPTHVVNTFCFFTSTYTVLHNGGDENGTGGLSYGYAHPGVGPHSDRERVTHHAYYQWVPFVLFAQALLFYTPHLIWRTIEGGTVRTMVDGLQRLYLRSFDKERDLQVANYHAYSASSEATIVAGLQRQFHTLARFRLNRCWATALVFCELLNFVNVVAQLKMLDSFLGGTFFATGRRILTESNPFEKVFPKITKCDFYQVGPSGTIQNHDAMCVMALNIVNEKIYYMLWFWLTALLVISAAALVWRALCYAMYRRSERFNRFLLREISGQKPNPVDVAILTRQSHFADWMLLMYLGGSMDSRLFLQLLHNLATSLADDSRPPSDYDDEKKPLKNA